LAISTLLGRLESMVEWCHPVCIHNTALEISKHVSKMTQLLAHHLFLPQRHHAKEQESNIANDYSLINLSCIAWYTLECLWLSHSW
jgi:hypothetical protein